MATYDEQIVHKPLTERAATAVNVAGAIVSLALVAGIGVWGYKLVMRDVTGIPVVRAMAGDMRVAPQNPGGTVAIHTGLSVNEVAAVGEAALPEDTLALAPRTQGLAEEDLVVQPLAEADEVRATASADTEVEVQTALNAELAETDVPLSTDDILALADRIAADADPLTDLAAGTDVAAQVSINGEDVSVPLIASSVPGVARSPRPVVRPASLSAAAATEVEQAPVEAQDIAIATDDIPVGTNLVQLGAYPSPDVAAIEWAALEARFGDYLTGKQRIIQEATSGGRTFYRLRAIGFADLSDARRLCAALEADNADCIPVVVR